MSLVNEDLAKEELKDNLKKRWQAMEVNKRESMVCVCGGGDDNADVRVVVR